MPVPVRRNVYSSGADFIRYVRGVKALKANGQYDDLIRAHYEVIDLVHGTPMFLPWHRAFLMDFEAKMRIALNDPTYAIPYWDWTDDANSPGHIGKLWDPLFMGQGNPVNTGPFANIPGQPPQWITISPNGEFGPNLQRGLTDDSADFQYTDKTIAANCFSKLYIAYDKFRVALESGPHGNMHVWVGGSAKGKLLGQMASVPNSVNDPVFWLHHANVDRMWAEWQELYPNSPITAPNFNFGPETPIPATSPGSPQKRVGDVVNIIGTAYRYDQSYVTRMMCAHPGHLDDPFLYYATFDDATQSWPEDRPFEKGNRGLDGVALANFNGVLFCAHRGNYDEYLWWTTFDPTDGWAEDKKFVHNNRSADGPGLFVFHNKLYCVHTGQAGDAELQWTSFDNNDWAQDMRFTNGNHGLDTPGLTTVGGSMVCLHRGYSDQQIYWSIFDHDSNIWTEDGEIYHGSRARGGIAVAIFGDKVYCVHAGDDGSPFMWWTTYNGNWGWNQDTMFSNGNRSAKTAGLAVHNGLLYCAHRGNNDDKLWWCTFDPTSNTWSEDQEFGHGSSTAGGCALGIYALKS